MLGLADIKVCWEGGKQKCLPESVCTPVTSRKHTKPLGSTPRLQQLTESAKVGLYRGTHVNGITKTEPGPGGNSFKGCSNHRQDLERGETWQFRRESPYTPDIKSVYWREEVIEYQLFSALSFPPELTNGSRFMQSYPAEQGLSGVLQQ